MWCACLKNESHRDLATSKSIHSLVRGFYLQGVRHRGMTSGAVLNLSVKTLANLQSAKPDERSRKDTSKRHWKLRLSIPKIQVTY